MIESSQEVRLTDCGICLEMFKNPYSTPCGHTFCEPCISGWLQRNPACPTCNTAVAQTFPNVFARQAVEAAAQEAAAAAKRALEQPQAPVAAAKPISPVAVKKIIPPTAPSSPVAKEIAEISRIEKTSSKPVGVHITVFAIPTGDMHHFRMPQTKGNAKLVIDAIAEHRLPPGCLVPNGAPAKMHVLVFNPPIDVKTFIKSQGNAAVKIPTKTFNQIVAIEFRDKFAILATDRGELVYHIANEYREHFLAAQTPQALEAITNRVVMQLLCQPAQLQATIIAPKATTREVVLKNLHTVLQLQLNNPAARLSEVIELESSLDPDSINYTGMTSERQIPKPVDKDSEEKGCPITVAVQIDQLVPLLQALGRIPKTD